MCTDKLPIVLLIPKLQSHFAEFLQLHSSIALIYSTHPLVSVFIMSSYPRSNKILRFSNMQLREPGCTHSTRGFIRNLVLFQVLCTKGKRYTLLLHYLPCIKVGLVHYRLPIKHSAFAFFLGTFAPLANNH